MKFQVANQYFRSSRTRRGMAIIELLVAMPMLLFLMFGIIEFGQYFYYQAIFESAARDAARFTVPATAQQGDPASAATRMLAASNVTYSSSWMTIHNVSNNTTVTDVSAVNPGSLLTITIQTTYSQLPGAYRPLYSYVGVGISNSKTVSGECSVVKE